MEECIRQKPHQILECRICQIRITFDRMNLQILIHTLDIHDIIKVYPKDLGAGLQIDESFFRSILRAHLTGPALVQFFCHPMKIIHIIRFQNIIDCMNLIALYRIFGISCGKDHHWRIGKFLDEVHTVDIGHVDVNEHSINISTGKHFLSLVDSPAGSDKLQIRYFINVSLQFFQSHRFVINGQASYFHTFTGIFSKTL